MSLQSPLRFLKSAHSNPNFTRISINSTRIPVVGTVSRVISYGEWITPTTLSRTKNIATITTDLSSISFFVMNKFIEDDNIFFYPEQQDEMTDVNTLVIAHTSPEIFEMVNGSLVTIRNRVNLPLNSSKVIGFLLPDLNSFNTSSVEETTSSARDALTSLSSLNNQFHHFHHL